MKQDHRAHRPSEQNGQKPKPEQNTQKPKEPCEASSLEALLKQAEGLQETLREAAIKLRELMTLLKQHQKESKSVQTVLASLRRLPSLHV